MNPAALDPAWDPSDTGALNTERPAKLWPESKKTMTGRYSFAKGTVMPFYGGFTVLGCWTGLLGMAMTTEDPCQHGQL